MTTLRCTAPHFVRCIIPNELKQPGKLPPPLTTQEFQKVNSDLEIQMPEDYKQKIIAKVMEWIQRCELLNS